MDGYVLVYITASNIEEGNKIAETIVEKRLCACANVVPKIHSFYWWEDKLREEDEVLILAKTIADKAEEVIKAVKAVHSYEVPAVFTIPVSKGNPDFLDWVRQETQEK